MVRNHPGSPSERRVASTGKQNRVRSVSKLKEISRRTDLEKPSERRSREDREKDINGRNCSAAAIQQSIFFRVLQDATRLIFVDYPLLERKIAQASFL